MSAIDKPNEEWRELSHSRIMDGYHLSTYGRIRFKDDDPYEAEYHSSNGYDYSAFMLKTEYVTSTSLTQLFPIDTLMGLTFLTYDPEKRNMNVRIHHIDGDTRNNKLSNLEWIEDKEEWRPLISTIKTKAGRIARVNPDDYMLSNKGRVYSVRNKSLMNPNVDNGYVKVALPYTIEGTNAVIRNNTKLHRILAMTFEIPGHSGQRRFINHINGIRNDNNLKNIEWVTPQENTRHAFAMGLEVNPKGQEHPRAKFTNHQRECVYEILKTLKWTPPKLLTKLIAERLPAISHDDVKYAKQVIKKTQGFEFPLLPRVPPGAIDNMSKEEVDAVRKVVYKIFDKYGIKGVEQYENKHRKND